MEVMYKDLVSVIIPTYNRSGTLSRAINSVLSQTYKNWELLIIDDGSTDNTNGLISQYQDERIEYIKLEKNGGASKARNVGITIAKGKFIGFLDSDDIWLPRKLELQLYKFKTTSDKLGIVGCSYIVNNKIIEPKYEGDIFYKQLIKDNLGGTPTLLIKKKYLNETEGFDEALPARQDYDLNLKILKNYTFSFVEEPLVKVIKDADNRITKNIEKRIEGNLLIIKKIKKEIESFNFIKKRVILSSQYFTLARYCQKNKKNLKSIRFLIKSLRQNIFNPKIYLLVGVILYSIFSQLFFLKK